MLAATAPLLLAAASAVGDPVGDPGSPKDAGRAGQHLRLTTSQLFSLAALAQQRGDVATAQSAYRALADNPDPDIRNEARYRHALLLRSAGANKDAAVLLRRIVDDRPDAGAARLQLATTLQALGDEEGAWRELRALRTTELPPTVARFVDRLSASLQATKPLGFQLELALAPNSNINRATRSDTLGTVIGDFTIDDGTKGKSGVGAAIRGAAHARWRLSDRIVLQARASTEASLYRDKDFNDISLDLSAGPEFRLGPSRLSFELGGVRQWYGMRPYQRGVRLAGAASVPIDAVSRARLDLGARLVDNRLNNLQDGKGLGLRLRYERALSADLMVAASLGADRFKARDDAYSTRSWQFGLSAYRDIGRMTVSAGVDIGRVEADERLVLLPEARKDRLTRFTIGIVNRNMTVAGFAPMTRLVMERNKSTVEFYDYKRTRVEFGVTRAF
ncbi:MAG TPA: surface lipoprotein assembly modifier [Sphingomicrobium sp.]|nr:surface lipoprotein assembly modifier [Sphingomicrobium sp.]